MLNKIKEHLELFDFDIRKTNDARYVDQKCTPDIICFMADCVWNIMSTMEVFTGKDIWTSQYFLNNSKVLFSKPKADKKEVQNEYNKVISQPLKTLAYSHILSVRKDGTTMYFSVENKSLLEYIAGSNLHAYYFLSIFYMKVLEDSRFMHRMEEYARNSQKEDSPKNARSILYAHYRNLIRGNTDSKSEFDIDRMFHKVFNIYAFTHDLCGSKGKPVTFSDLLYNKENFRDKGKRKDISRKEARRASTKEQPNANEVAAYMENKAKAIVKRLHSPFSEVQDAYANGDATHVHHIFPKHIQPLMAGCVENLILLTPTQHNVMAHPKNKTKEIDFSYQMTCLLAKSRTIEKSIAEYGERYYSKSTFIDVINMGLCIDIEPDASFEEIRVAIRAAYSQV